MLAIKLLAGSKVNMLERHGETLNGLNTVSSIEVTLKHFSKIAMYTMEPESSIISDTHKFAGLVGSSFHPL